uniref:Uncharacterized protein n=1 Tax=Pinctada fucata TaxID=50426 RepID=A0A194AKJ3_PINFU
MTKTVSPTDLISMVQQNIINETDENVVFNFDIYDQANRQCVYLSKSKQRVPVNCSNKFPALCYGDTYGRRKQQPNTVISVSKLCPEDFEKLARSCS